MNITEIEQAAHRMRKNILRLAAKAGAEGKGAHIAPSLSAVEILATLFLDIMRPQDVFILSKGHGGLAYYAALKEAGIISGEQLDSYEIDGGDFPGQPRKNIESQIAFSGGSLGMGLSYSCGLAIAAKNCNDDKNIYVLLGNGELNEGSNWEAVMLAKQYGLSNIVVIIDDNGLQLDGKSTEIIDIDLENIFRSFGWETQTCDGHLTEKLSAAFKFSENASPKVLFAKTIKGKGVSFMENNNAWHHSRLTEEKYQEAMEEVEHGGI